MRFGLLLPAMLFCCPSVVLAQQSPAPLVTGEEGESHEPTRFDPLSPAFTPHQARSERDEAAPGELRFERYWIPLLVADVAVAIGSSQEPAIGLGYLLVPPLIHLLVYDNLVGAGQSLLTRLLLPVGFTLVGLGVHLAATGGDAESGIVFIGNSGALAGLIIGSCLGILAAMVIDYFSFAKVEAAQEPGGQEVQWN